MNQSLVENLTDKELAGYVVNESLNATDRLLVDREAACRFVRKQGGLMRSEHVRKK